MQCLQCGSSNPGTAHRCAACGAVMQEDVVVQPGADEPDTFRKAWDAWRYTRADRKAGIALAFGVLAAWAMYSSLDAENGVPLFTLGALLAVFGILVGREALGSSGRRAESVPERALAGGGALLSVGVLAAPVVFAAGQIAMIPRRIATEPIAINNVRHLSVALQTYLEDNDDRLPGWVTFPDGHLYHNVWDQQLAPYVKDDDMFGDGASGHGIRSPWAPAPRRRVLSFGLNGLLITSPKQAFDGNADWSRGPAGYTPNSFAEPTTTIVFAEVATRRNMGGLYAKPDVPPRNAPFGDSSAYHRAMTQWVDIDPRAWVETSGPEKSYNRRTWDSDRGVARDLHSGGAACSFLDGHVEFVKLRRTVNGGQLGLPAGNYWKPDNRNNMWNPMR